MVVWAWVKTNWPLVAAIVLLALVCIAITIKVQADDKARAAAAEIETSDLEGLPDIVVRPSRVERSSGRVVDQVEDELDAATAPRPEDNPDGDDAARRSDAAWRDGIGRLRDEASRY